MVADFNDCGNRAPDPGESGRAAHDETAARRERPARAAPGSKRKSLGATYFMVDSAMCWKSEANGARWSALGRRRLRREDADPAEFDGRSINRFLHAPPRDIDSTEFPTCAAHNSSHICAQLLKMVKLCSPVDFRSRIAS